VGVGGEIQSRKNLSKHQKECAKKAPAMFCDYSLKRAEQGVLTVGKREAHAKGAAATTAQKS